MRRWIAVSVLVLGTMFGFAAQARSETLLEKILTTVLADRFGIDTDQVIKVRSDSKSSIFDLGEIFSGAFRLNSTADKVWRLRKQGLGWGQIAHQLGMHPGTFNKMRNSGAFDSGRVWGDIFKQRFGTRNEDYEVIRKGGAKLEDIIAAVVVGKATNRSPQQVYDDYKRVKNWDTVCSKAGVKMSDWKRYANKPAMPPRDGDDSGSVGPGNSGKGNQGKGKGKGKGGGRGGF